MPRWLAECASPIGARATHCADALHGVPATFVIQRLRAPIDDLGGPLRNVGSTPACRRGSILAGQKWEGISVHLVELVPCWQQRESSVRLSVLAITGFIAMSSFGSAPAATYNYLGRPDSRTGNYLTATMDLNCIAPCPAGDYDPFGSSPGIVSFVLSAYSSSGVLLASLASSDQLFPSIFPVFELNFYLRVDQTGQVTNWSMYRYGRTIAGDDIAIISLGFGLPGLSQVDDPLVSGEFLNGTFLVDWDSPSGSTNPPIGDWTQSGVPLPTALPLFATVLASAVLIAWRRKRKSRRAQ